MTRHLDRVAAFLLAAAFVVGATDPVSAKKPPSCTAARFLVRGDSILTGAPEHDLEPIVLDATGLSIATACPSAKARLKRTKHGTNVRATWRACEGFTGRVKLNGRTSADCTAFSGKLVAKKSKVKRSFTAIASSCGDELVDGGVGEGCEPPGTLTCSDECQSRPAPAPAITIDTPTSLSLTSAESTAVAGTVSASVVGVACNGGAVTLETGSFSGNVALNEGQNTITCVATTADARAATATVIVSRDSTAPRIGITTPKAGSTLTGGSVTVAGFVNDLVAAALSTADPLVVCNGIQATVANRTFSARAVLLVAGANEIGCTATDAAGNHATTIVNVAFALPAGARIRPVSGDGQTKPIGQTLAAPFVVLLEDAASQPVAGKTVVFRVVENDGTLAGGSGSPRARMVVTDGAGHASVTMTLGTRAGAGNQQVRATAVGFAGEAVFTASATEGAAARIVVDSGNLQHGLVGHALPRPFVATVIDAGNNRLAGVPVTFTVEAGGGTLDATSVPTDLDGRAHAFLTLGSAPGPDNQIVAATFAGNTGAAVRFVATALAGGDPDATRISGVVLDNSNVPLPDVLVGVGNTNIQTMTDDQGQFTLEHAPVGRVDLWVIGSTTARPGSWPSLPYEIVTVAGEDNTLGMPIYLPQLDVAHGVQMDLTHGGTIAPPDLPGFALEIAPGSALFPDGTHRGLVTVTAVHPDKIPMIPQFGQQPRFIVTIQPAGTRFDPPARLTIPNADGLAPGQKTEMFSFDHDIRSFVTIGTGTVSEDGSVIRSDPGVGVVKAGWHCGGNPSSIGTCEHQCDDGNDCTDDALGAGGSCTHTPSPDGKPCRPAQDSLSCNGGTISISCGKTRDMCQGGKCPDAPGPGGGPSKGQAYAAAQALCTGLGQSNGCSGAVGAEMFNDLKGKNIRILCINQPGCYGEDCACAPENQPGNIILGTSTTSSAKCGNLPGILRHEMQHLLLGHDHTKPITNCATDKVYGCDAACGHRTCCTVAGAACMKFTGKASAGNCKL